MLAVHRFSADIYSKKFPELEGMVPNPIEYGRVVERIQNEMVVSVYVFISMALSLKYLPGIVFTVYYRI